jgi:hypothetical protein
VAVAVGVVLQVGGQVFVGFGDAPEPVDGPGIGVVAVGVVLAVMPRPFRDAAVLRDWPGRLRDS